MGLMINTNVMAINAQRNLSVTGLKMGKAMERLSSGFRINRAADDAAGLAISEKLRAQIKGLSQASRNAQDGVSLVQTAEGALTETHSILQRMRELAIQSGTATLVNADRTQLQAEVTALLAEVDRIAQSTTFNGAVLLDGTFSGDLLVGSDAGAQNIIAVAVSNMQTAAAGLNIAAITVATQAGAQAAVATLDTAIASVSTQRASLGAIQNRLEHTVASLGVTIENLSASDSRIREADIAVESSALVAAQILQQAGTAVLAQANSAPQAVLSLLKG